MYKVSVQMVKFVQGTIEMLDKQRASIGVPEKHEMDKVSASQLHSFPLQAISPSGHRM